MIFDPTKPDLSSLLKKNIEQKNTTLKDESVSPIHTYKSDVAEYIKSEGKTLADIAVAESQRQDKLITEDSDAPQKAKKAMHIIIVTLSLLLFSGGIFWITINWKPKVEEPAVVNLGPKIFISSINEKNVSIGTNRGYGATNEIGIALKENSPLLALKISAEIDKKETTLNVRDFLDRIDVYPPADLLRSLNDEFSVGSIRGGERFLVFKTNYYSGAFAGMLDWEKTMASDLREFLLLPYPENQNATTTTAGPNKIDFSDSVIANRDARILRDGKGNIIVLYTFPDNETVVVTKSESSAKTVSEKLLRTGGQ